MNPTLSCWPRSAGEYGGIPAYLYRMRSKRIWAPAPQPQIVRSPASSKMLTAHSSAILGENGVRRFKEFSSYRDGWDFGGGYALSVQSVQRMEEFLSQFSVFDRRPSLFLTRPGNLMLGWEDQAGDVIELEFTARGFALFLGASDEDHEFSAGDLGQLVGLLSQVSANGAT